MSHSQTTVRSQADLDLHTHLVMTNQMVMLDIVRHQANIRKHLRNERSMPQGGTRDTIPLRLTVLILNFEIN